MPSREQLVHLLYEAAELEHDLMCTYLYAAFSLRSGEAEGLSANEAGAVARWRATMIRIAIEEMGHLAAVWNITAGLGASPRFNRENFPLAPGSLPASVVVKLAPFGEAALQHFVHLERPADSAEPEGAGFAYEIPFKRGSDRPRLTPMAVDYETVGAFYAALGEALRTFVEEHGESGAFCGDPELQLSTTETELVGTKPVICLKTALAALSAIVEQGEGAPGHSETSHFTRFHQIHDELVALQAANPAFTPAFPAATNPLLRRPVVAEHRVWIENEDAARVVDLANASYQLMLRLLAYSYVVPRSAPEKRLAVDLALGLMRAFTLLAERAARLPAGPSHPDCNAGVSFTALRDAAPFAPGHSAWQFFDERFAELAAGIAAIEGGDPRITGARRVFDDLAVRVKRAFTVPAVPVAKRSPALAVVAPPPPVSVAGIDDIEGKDMTLVYEGKRCIHSRFCVTGAPTVFLANVQGPWIHPAAIPVDALVEIAHACPSGAIRYRRKDGHADEQAPPVNLISIRENGPYGTRAAIVLDGVASGYRATLCRCGASKTKPYCDGSHHAIDFAATGEPLTEGADMLATRDGALEIDPQVDGPLRIRGNLEITSGTGRVVARVTQAKLCRCGGSATKPFCDGTHQRIGFRS
ncbi:MAG: ferritin-like domain-containing protein [Kofleriaceae bacterium]